MAAEIRIVIADESPEGTSTSTAPASGTGAPPDLASRWDRVLAPVGDSLNRFNTRLGAAQSAIGLTASRFAAGLNQSLTTVNTAITAFGQRLNAVTPPPPGGGGGGGGGRPPAGGGGGGGGRRPARTPAQATRRNRARRRLQRIRSGRSAAAQAAKQAARQAKQAAAAQARSARAAARRGAQMAKASMRASAQKQKAAAAAQKKTAAQATARRQQVATAAGGAAAAVIRGGGPGAAIGGAGGAVLGGRFGGPAGAAIGGAIGEKVGGAVDNPLKGPAEFSEKVAAGDGMGAVASAANTAAAGLALTSVALGPLAPIGITAAAGLKTFTSVVESAREVMGAFAARGRELSGYNGQIAGAAAMQDVTRTLTDIREAQMLGGPYAKVIEAQTKFEETLRAGLLPIKEVMLEQVPPVMNAILDGILTLVMLAKAVPGINNAFVDKMLARMLEIKNAIEKGDAPTDLVEAWLGMGAVWTAPIGEAPKPGPVAIPLFAAP